MKKIDKKAFTLIELIVVIAIIGILVLLGIPRFTGHKDKVELARIQHDVKVMEQEIGAMFINGDDDFNSWENNNKDLNQLVQESKLFKKEGIVKKIEVFSTDETYKVIPEKYKDKINTKLKGTFYANSNGKVYYEHTKSLSGIPSEPEKNPEYSDEEIQDLIKNNFIPVATADELNNVRSATLETYGKGTKWEGLYTGGLDKKYIQVAKIDLSEYSEEGWKPIGSYTSSTDKSPFIGSFDGNGYKIAGLTINRPEEDYVGLFGYTEGATIRNVALENVKVTGDVYVGGLVGEAYNSTIENSYSTGSVTGDTYAGGLVGRAYTSTIENSYATGLVTGTDYVGGLVGQTVYDATISNSYATGSVEGSSNVGGLVGEADSGVITNSYAEGSVTGEYYVGGLVGDAYATSTISNSYATGEVTGTDDVGGLAGWATDSAISNSYATGSVSGDTYVGGLVSEAYNSTIENSYATGDVTGTSDYGDNVGGLVGFAHESTIENSYATGEVMGSNQVGGLVGEAGDGTISNSYATGSVTGTDFVGGLVGDAYTGTNISNSYWNTETTGQSTSAGGVGKTTEEMKKKETYLNEVSNWDFDTVWEITPENYPTLR